MSSFILDLQQEVIKPNCDITSVLLQAHIIAHKLKLVEFDKWIYNELYGYQTDDTVPNYRIVYGILEAFDQNRWKPLFTPKIDDQAVTIRESISKVIDLCSLNGDSLYFHTSGERLKSFNASYNKSSNQLMIIPFQHKVFKTSIREIIETVRKLVLDWALKLEDEGIHGENMQFKSTEIETAKQIPQTINYYFGNINVINSPVDHSTVVAGNNNTVP